MSSTPEYKAWISMKSRCHDSNYQSTGHYKGRGISICKEWLDNFLSFYEDMGDRPSSKHSLDRIDNDGNYEPSNCKWSTSKEQQHNKRQHPSALGIKNVYLSGQKYRVRFFRDAVKTELGTYGTLEEAISVRDDYLEGVSQ